MDKKAVRKVARETRKWVMRLVKKTGHCKTTGFCAIATAKLYETMIVREEFAGVKIVPVIIEHHSQGCHAFLSLSIKARDLLVDVTADQFNFGPYYSRSDFPEVKAVEIRPLKEGWLPWFWSGYDLYGNKLRIFRGIQTFKRRVAKWDDSQSPQSYGLLN